MDSVKNWKRKPCQLFLKTTWNYEEKSEEKNLGDLCKCVKGAKTKKQSENSVVFKSKYSLMPPNYFDLTT